MLHHQGWAKCVDGKHLLQISRIKMGKAALGLPCLAMQKTGCHHQHLQRLAGAGAALSHELRRSFQAGLTAVIYRRQAAAAQADDL